MTDFKTYTITPDEKQRIISVIKELLESRPEIVFAYIFGSFIDEDAGFFRDIDIGIYIEDRSFSKKHSLDYSINLSLELERLLKNYSVGVLALNGAPLPIAFHVTEGILIFSKDEDLWTEFVTKTWSLYHDHSISSGYVLEDLVSGCIDKDRMSAYVSEIKTALETLKAYSKMDRETFLASPLIIRDTKYSFIMAGQASIDICYHLTAKLLKRAPTSYGNCFEILGESGLFSKDIISKISVMAKFRNVLVHHYIKVDNEQVYDRLKEIDIFERFCDELNNLLKSMKMKGDNS